MQYHLRIAKSFPMLILIFILATNISLPIMMIAKQARAATTALSYSSFRLHSNIATITNVQLPGILPNNNNNNNPSPPIVSSSSSTISNSSASVNNRQTSAIATTTTTTPLVHRNTRARSAAGGPTLNDIDLKLERIVDTGLRSTASMAFLGPNDILVLEKDTGLVHRILNGKMLPEPVLDVNVANEAERGLLGIAVAKNGDSDAENGDDNNKNARHVFLYYTESGGGKDGDDASSGIEPAANRLYRYNLDENNNKLTNPLLLLNLPASPPSGRENIERQHMGGKVLIGPDNNVYLGIGDVGGHRTQSENNPNGAAPDGTGGILRVTQDGQIVDNPPLGESLPLALYYAYGIRNTFGIDFDPVTGNLWETENGDTFGGEINLVKP